MCQRTALIFNKISHRKLNAILASLGALGFLLSCSSFDKNKLIDGPVKANIVGKYEETWRALQKSMVNYPIKINNVDRGVLETDKIKLGEVWTPPVALNKVPRNTRYSLHVRVTRGKTSNKDSARIQIRKKMVLHRDFFSGGEKIKSDGLEEKAILYRIRREIRLERSIQKAFQENKSS